MENIVGITQNVLEIWLIAQKNAVKNNADFDIEHDDGKYGLNYPKYAQNLVNWLKKILKNNVYNNPDFNIENSDGKYG